MSSETAVLTEDRARTSAPVATIDLRSDTVTKPTPAMRAAMAAAEVGDDVHGEDPTINRLEARAAEIFGREAGLFLPSGTMGNQTAIRLNTQHGQEVICDARSHIVEWEIAMASAFSGCQLRTIAAHRGILTWREIEPHITGKHYHRAPTGLIALENTHNMAGGTVTPLDCDGRDLGGSAGARSAGPSRRRSHLQCVGRTRHRRPRAHPRLFYRDVLPLERTRCAGGLHAGRHVRPDGSRASHSQSTGRRHAPGRHPRRGRADRSGRRARSASTKTMPTRASSQRRLAEAPVEIDLDATRTNIVLITSAQSGRRRGLRRQAQAARNPGRHHRSPQRSLRHPPRCGPSRLRRGRARCRRGSYRIAPNAAQDHRYNQINAPHRPLANCVE